jgi:signal transduction histidine kinase
MTLERDILAAKILIVDDQPANVRVLSRLLTEAGYSQVTSTMNPSEVRALYGRNDYDLILLDLLMPVMDGFAVMEALRTNGVKSYVPVIVLTVEPNYKLRALQAGAKDFISKPFDLAEVKTRVRNMLEMRMLYRNLERQNRLLEQAVQDRTGELRELAGYLITAREDEKAHLARELHDELGALLTAAKLNLARLRGKLFEDPAIADRLQQVNKLLDEGISLKRRIVEDLRPSSLAMFGLTISLANLCAEVGASLSITIKVELDEVCLSQDGHLAIYRLVQEALNNVCKYAKATQVRVSVKSEPTQVRVQIEDDGIGFDPSQPKSAAHGIAGMRFRIEQLDGRMSVASSPGAGTLLEAIMPVTVAAAAAG